MITRTIPAVKAARATHAPHRAALRCFGLSVGIAIALAGCTHPERTADATGEFTISLISDGIFLLTDKRTSCEYIALGRGGIILRSDAYGNVTPNCASGLALHQSAPRRPFSDLADDLRKGRGL